MRTSLPDLDVEQEAQELSRQLLAEPDPRYPGDELRIAQLEIAFAERSTCASELRGRSRHLELLRAARHWIFRHRT